ncbi:MAG: hypothetical protein EOP83_37480 [Verrucomicrobiaceae bacterium]|nr:MAG: hypothetical protein EOP83_37480 [Verrucomicrobiaceae bacterium]
MNARSRRQTAEQRAAEDSEVALCVGQAKTAVLSADATHAPAGLHEGNVHPLQGMMDSRAFVRFHTTVDDDAIEVCSAREHQYVLGEAHWPDDIRTELLHRAIEREGNKKLAFDDKDALALEFPTKSAHCPISRSIAVVSGVSGERSSRHCQVRTRLRHVFASGVWSV